MSIRNILLSSIFCIGFTSLSFASSNPLSQEDLSEEDLLLKNSDEYNVGRWSDQEQEIFLDALEILGADDWVAIADYLQQHEVRRSNIQCRTHFQKLCKASEREAMREAKVKKIRRNSHGLSISH